MKLAIVGSRGFTNRQLMWSSVQELGLPIDMIISGGARGADTLAAEYAKEHDIALKLHKPQWAKFGLAAGPVRNRKIVKDADCVLVFWDGKSRGSKSSIRIAEKLHKRLIVVRFTPQPTQRKGTA